MTTQKTTTITKKIMELRLMGPLALQARFKELYGFPTKQTSPIALRKRLAFRIQELHYGGFTDEEERTLQDLASHDDMAMLKTNSQGEAPLMPGVRLTRAWKGKLHEVTVMNDGRFEYNGRIFRSLSGVATEITGSHWNGKTFFGVKHGK